VIEEDLVQSTNKLLEGQFDIDVDLDATPVSPSLLSAASAPEPTASHVRRWVALGLVLAVCIAGFLLLFLD
jgi:hypothetical protein